MSAAQKVSLKLPATSANLGPGFDTAALALDLYLEIEAEPAASFSIDASGFDVDICAQVEGNLLLSTYEQAMAAHGAEATSLAITMRNGIPLGMGCGSSAATRLAGVALAAAFGGCTPDRDQILAEAVRLEGHPDNAAACWLGGFVVSAVCGDRVLAHSVRPPAWHALVAMPLEPLATTASRKILPESYARGDVVYNLQRMALLTAAFASGQADLLLCASSDRIHQPHRAEACPLLGKLLPLAGTAGILSVTLSGAGPAVLLLLRSAADAPEAERLLRNAAEDVVLTGVLSCKLTPDPASYSWY